MPDGSDWNVRGELNSSLDSMVTSGTGWQHMEDDVERNLNIVESADWEHGYRDRPWYHGKKNYDLHGGQNGIKSCPAGLTNKNTMSIEQRHERHPFPVDNKLIDENNDQNRVKKGFELVKEEDAGFGMEKSDETEGEKTEAGYSFVNSQKKFNGKQLCGNKHSTRVEKREKSKTRKGSLHAVTEPKKGSIEPGGMMKANEKYKVNKEQSEIFAKWKHVEMEDEKFRADASEKLTVTEGLSSKEIFNSRLKEMDKKYLEDHSKLSCCVEKEETIVKRAIDHSAENVAEKQDPSKDSLSYGFSITDSGPQMDHQPSCSFEESYKDIGRTPDETSWSNTADSFDDTDSDLTKQQSEMESIEYSTWTTMDKKSGVSLLVDNRDLDELWKGFGFLIQLLDEDKLMEFKWLNWLQTMKTGYINCHTSDWKNQAQKMIQVEIQKLLREKASCTLYSTDPQNPDKSFEKDKKVVDMNQSKFDADNAEYVDENFEDDIDESFSAAVTPISDAENNENVNYECDIEVEIDTNEHDESADIEDESEEVSDADTEEVSDADTVEVLDADEKDCGESEKNSKHPENTAKLEVEKDFGSSAAVNDLIGKVDTGQCPAGKVNSDINIYEIDVEYTAVRESGRKKIDSLKTAKLPLPALHQLQIQVMELQMEVDKLDARFRIGEFELDARKRRYLLCFNARCGSCSGGEQIHSIFHTRDHSQDYFAGKMPNPILPISDKFVTKKKADRKGIGLLRSCHGVGRQCADHGHGKGDRGNNSGDKEDDESKNRKNRKNEEDKNSYRSNDNNDDKNSNNNNPSQKTPGIKNVGSDPEEEQHQHGRSAGEVQVPDNDYKAYRKKKHKVHDNFDWLEKLHNELSEKGGPSFSLFAVLTDKEDVCVEVCLSRPGDISGEALNCFVCMTVDSLLKHFTNCNSGFNSCDMCVKFFSLLCSHVAVCSSGNVNVKCDIDICQAVIKMIPSTSIESHVKTLWFQVRKKFARIIGIVEPEVQMVEVPEKQRKPSLVRKPSGSGPLPSIPEMSVIPNTSLSNSAIVRRRICQMRILGEGDGDIGEAVDAAGETLECVDFGAAAMNDDEGESSSIPRPETVPDSDAMPTSSEDGSIEEGSGHSAVSKRFVSLPPTGPPCVGDTYFPSFQDRPTGIRGIGEVVYADRNQMLVVVTVWEKFKTQFQREAKLAKHYREEGVILSKFKNKLKIHKLRYNTDFQWVKVAHLGNGMTGKCHLAMDFETEFKFCVKEIHISNYEKDEIELMSALDHEYIVQVYGAIRHAEKIYILQEFIEGGCLTEAINIQKKLGRRLSQLTALRYFQQLLKVLVYLKKCNILHEDIKADNILLDRNIDDESGPSAIRVTDFGMARRCQGSVQIGRKPVGTQTQWSPEKAEAVGYGYPAEVWAAICVLVHMLSGLPPWVRRFEEMKALILVIVDKSPPMEDIPRNILETIQDLIRRGFTVCQGQRPTAEKLLNHSAFQLLGESSTTNGIYSILESVHYQSSSIAEATNSIEDDPSADKRELHRKEVGVYGGAGASCISNLGFAIPAQELTIFPVEHSNGNSGAASVVGNDTNDANVTSRENAAVGCDSRENYDMQLLFTQAQNDHTTNNLQTPSSAQPSQSNDPLTAYLNDEFPQIPILPTLSIYQPSMIYDGPEAEVDDVKPEVEKVTIESVTATLIPDFEKLLESSEDQSSHFSVEDDPDENLAHVIRQYTSPECRTSSGDNNRVVNKPDEDVTEPGGNVNSHENEEFVESVSSNFDDDELFASGPADHIKDGMRRQTHSEDDLLHLPKSSNTRNEPMSAPPFLNHITNPSLLVTQSSSLYNQRPSLSQLLPGTGTNTMAVSMSPVVAGRNSNSSTTSHNNTSINNGGFIMQHVHHSPRNMVPTNHMNPHSLTNMPNHMTSTPVSNPQVGVGPTSTMHHPRVLFPGDSSSNMSKQMNLSSVGNNQFTNQPMHFRLPTSVALQQYWPTNAESTYRQEKIALLQPKTPILNPVINPKAWANQGGSRSPDLQLDIKKAQEGTDIPISSQVYTAPVFSPPKTPKKSPDLYRAQSEVPTAWKKSSYTLGSSPNDQLSTSTTRSQFEEQDVVFKELGRTAEEALSQHSDHWMGIAVSDDEYDDRVFGELDNEIMDNPAESFAHLLDAEDVSVTITFRSVVNGKEIRMKFKSNYFSRQWRHIIEEAMDGFSWHNMPRDYGLTRFNLKLQDGDFIDLENSLGNKSLTLLMKEAIDSDPWWIERGMIYSTS